MEDALRIPAVGAANQEENVRFQSGNFLGVILGQLEGVGFEDLGSGPQAGLPGGLGRELRNQAGGHHPEPSGGGGAGVPVGKGQRTGLCFQQGQGIGEALRHIRLHRGVGGGGTQEKLSV